MRQESKAIKCVTLCKYKSRNDDLYVVSILDTAPKNIKQEATEIHLFFATNKMREKLQICLANKAKEKFHCTLNKLIHLYPEKPHVRTLK